MADLLRDIGLTNQSSTNRYRPTLPPNPTKASASSCCFHLLSKTEPYEGLHSASHGVTEFAK
jgi:hypothetical protein